VRLARLDGRPQRRPLAEQMLLADQLAERSRAHPHRQRGLGNRDRSACVVALGGAVEEAIGHRLSVWRQGQG
jgi:hypothetical protein